MIQFARGGDDLPKAKTIEIHEKTVASEMVSISTTGSPTLDSLQETGSTFEDTGKMPRLAMRAAHRYY